MKNINEKELTKYVLKKLQESYFDEFEFDKDAMKAAMSDIDSDSTAGEFEELGTSKFEKSPKFKEKFKSSLKQANLELPSDEAEVEHYAELLKKRKAQEDRFGKGSMNESDEAYEENRYMFFSNLQQIRRQTELLLDMDEELLNSILENGHDWAQDHIATAKESIDQVFDFLMNETSNGDLENREDKESEDMEEGMGHSYTIGHGENIKPVNYPEDLQENLGKYYVEDTDFNKANYPDLVGKFFEDEPAEGIDIKKIETEEEIEESSSNSLINKKGKNAKPNASYLKEEYENIIELQDNQANHIFTLLKQDGPEEAIEYLKEFHKPGTHNILSEIKKSSLNKHYEKDGYTLTWNPSIGFVKLSYKKN